MSSLIVDVTKVLSIKDHPNADRLSIVTVKGWEVITAKKDDGDHNYKVGDKVVYCPIDSVLPQELSDSMDITKYLSKGRVLTTKLRGSYSQGLIIPISYIPDHMREEGTSVGEYLGIKKYERPIKFSLSGLQATSPQRFRRFTSIENIKNFINILQLGEEVVITEKIHGTNFRCGILDGEFLVGSHNVCLKENDNNLYWQIAKKYNFKDILTEGQIIYGEIYGDGVQPLKYGLTNEKKFIAFGLIQDDKYLNYDDFKEFCQVKNIPTAPELYKGKWDMDLVSLVSGKSTMPNASHIREGFVVTPLVEREARSVGRVCLKAISEEYLLKKFDDNGEYDH